METPNRCAHMPGRLSDQFVIRMPDGMRDRIKMRAESNRRSMNAELIMLIEDAMKASDQKQGGRQ